MILRRQQVTNFKYGPYDIAVAPDGTVHIPVHYYYDLFGGNYDYYLTPSGWRSTRITNSERSYTNFATAFAPNNNLLLCYSVTRGWDQYQRSVLCYGSVENGTYTQIAERDPGYIWGPGQMVANEAGTPFFLMRSYRSSGPDDSQLYKNEAGSFVQVGLDWSVDVPAPPEYNAWVSLRDEPRIAARGNTVVIDWIVGEDWGAAIASKVSRDGGQTWSEASVIDTSDFDPAHLSVFDNVIPQIASDGSVRHMASRFKIGVADSLGLYYYDETGNSTLAHAIPSTEHFQSEYWDWVLAEGDVPYVMLRSYTQGKTFWGPVGDVSFVLAQDMGSGRGALVTTDAAGKPYFAIGEGQGTVYAYFVPKGPDVSVFSLTVAGGTETGGELTTEARQNTIVYKTGLEPPSTQFRAYPVDNETLSAGEIDNLKDAYAGQFSHLGVSHMGGDPSDDYWERLRQFRIGEREEQLNTTLKGTFALNVEGGGQRAVDIQLSVDGRAVGRASRMLDDLGGSLRMVVEHGVGKALKASGLTQRIESELINQFLAYGVTEAADWSLDRLLTEWEQRANDFASSAFKAHYGGTLKLDPERDGSFVSVSNVEDGYYEWTNSILGIPDKRDGSLIGNVKGLVINTNQDIPFEIDLETSAATAGTSLGSAGVIRSVTLTVTNASDPTDVAYQRTWLVDGDDIYPQLYRDADENYAVNWALEYMTETSLAGLDFLNRTVFTVGTKVIEDGVDVLTNSPFGLESLMNPECTFLQDQSCIVGRTASPAFHSQALTVSEDADELVIEYGLLSSLETVDPDCMQFSIWLEDDTGAIDLLETDFADLTFAAVDPVDGLGWFSGPMELRYDLTGLEPGSKVLGVLLDTVDGFLYEGAFIIDSIYVTSPVPEPASLCLLLFGGLGVLLKRRRAGGPSGALRQCLHAE